MSVCVDTCQAERTREGERGCGRGIEKDMEDEKGDGMNWGWVWDCGCGRERGRGRDGGKKRVRGSFFYLTSLSISSFPCLTCHSHFSSLFVFLLFFLSVSVSLSFTISF